MSQTFKQRKPVRRVVLVLGILVIGALLAEGAVRARIWLRTGAFGYVHVLVTDPASGQKIPKPGRSVGGVRIDSRGFRSPELEVPKPKGRVRLAFIGGSTTYCAEASSNEHTWPHLVWQQLSDAYPEVEFDYLNASVAGYATGNSLLNLEKRVRRFEPDVIFIYHATNDLTKDTRELAIEQGCYAGHGDSKDWLTEHSIAWNLVKKNFNFRKRVKNAEHEEETKHLEFDPHALSVGFRERLTQLVEDSKAIAPVVVLITFSQSTRSGQTPEEQLAAASSSLYYMPYMTVAGVLAGFEEYNVVIREVAQATGVLLVEGEDGIPVDATHFNDSVHFKDAGCVKQAERVMQRLMGSEDLKQLLQ